MVYHIIPQVQLLVVLMILFEVSIGTPSKEKELKQAFTDHRLNLLEGGFKVFANENSQRNEFVDHRLDLLENGFNVFANEVFPKMEKMQKKIRFVSDTNKELSQKVKTVTEENEHIVEELVRQESVISDLLWVAGELKTNELSTEERNTLSEIEWAVFDLKQSTLNLMEDMCLKESKCSEWSDWGACSVSCGTGSAYRSRECSNDGKFKSYCSPLASEATNCYERKCNVILGTVFQDLDCPENFVSYKGYCFRLSDDRASRLLSSIMCETDDAHLVEIDNPKKQAIVTQYLRDVGLSYMNEIDIVLNSDTDMGKNVDDNSLTSNTIETQIAIDGIRHKQETDYLNWKEKAMGFFQWATGQPRNDKSDGDYCLTMDPEDGSWYLRCCSIRFYYICEAPPGGIY